MGELRTIQLPLEQALLEEASEERVLYLFRNSPHQASSLNRDGRPVFFALAGHPKAQTILQEFLDAGVSLDQRDSNGRSFFLTALLEGSSHGLRRPQVNAWLPRRFPGALMEYLLTLDGKQWSHSDSSDKRAVVLALEANHPRAVEWLIGRGADAYSSHAGAGFKFPLWVWALATPNAGKECLESCLPRGTMPPLALGERQFILNQSRQVLASPQSALFWLEKIAVWEQRGGKLMTSDTWDLTDLTVRAFRRAQSMETPSGKLGSVLLERQRNWLLATGYPARWPQLNAWCLHHRLDAALNDGQTAGGRKRL